MSKQIPMLMKSPLTKRVFVVTSYKDNGDGTFTARQKFDITEQFNALAEMWRGECEMEIEDEIEDMCGEHYVYFIGWTCSKCGNQVTSMCEDDAPKFCPECGAKVRKAVKR